MQEGLFAIGDYVGGGVVGAVTAAGVRGIVSPELDMVLAMLIGMAIGMGVHVVLGLVLTPVLGAFQVMVPGGLIGMYGGMFFAMRDTMQHSGARSAPILVGFVFGLVMTAGMRLYDRALRAPVSASRTS
jgi:hypothetical protein